jgi:hypothetical protein
MPKSKKPAWPAEQIEKIPVADLRDNPYNSRTHSAEQIAQIARSMAEWGWTMPILVDEGGTIIAGHARAAAARSLGFKEAPCMRAVGWSEAQKRAYVIADNKLTENGGWDMGLLGAELEALADMGFDTALTGFGDKEIRDIFETAEEGENPYTSKIKSPIYLPNGERPEISECIDKTRFLKLKEKIKKTKIDKKLKDFLIFAAGRHIVFNYSKIADLYAHSTKEEQELFEDSALVIIDFNKAIEQGFVELSKKLDDALGDRLDEQ